MNMLKCCLCTVLRLPTDRMENFVLIVCCLSHTLSHTASILLTRKSSGEKVFVSISCLSLLVSGSPLKGHFWEVRHFFYLTLLMTKTRLLEEGGAGDCIQGVGVCVSAFAFIYAAYVCRESRNAAAP